jgi:hypothetical protein
MRFSGHAASGRKAAQPPPGRAEVQAPGSAPGGIATPGRDHATLAAPQPESLVTGGVRSLEVRWIFPGQLEDAVAGWFSQFPAAVESREDTYLLEPQLHGLSVKIRGGMALEVKAYLGSPGRLDVAGRALGSMESWQKWSHSCGPLSQGSGDPACWKPVGKTRRITQFCVAGERTVARAPEKGDEPRCDVELTEIRAAGQDWWSLGLEASGPAGLARSTLEATATVVLAQDLPGGLRPGPDECRSYAEWLGQRPDPGTDA